MDILSTILDFSKYETSFLYKMFKKPHEPWHQDDEINKLKKQNLLNEYENWIKEVTLLDVSYEEGNGKITLLNNINYLNEPSNIKFCYYKLQNNNFLYYLKFNDNDYEEYEEMIVILNSDGKYICIGQQVYHLFIYTDKFFYDETDGSLDAIFGYNINLADLKKESLLTIASDLFISAVNEHWSNEDQLSDDE